MKRTAAPATVLAAVLTSCASSPNGQKIVVFARASPQTTFTEIGEQSKTENPGVVVDFSFAGSSDVVAQLTQNMDKAAEAGQKTLNQAGFGKP
jgi:molybdate transport system substrate-binding protein